MIYHLNFNIFDCTINIITKLTCTHYFNILKTTAYIPKIFLSEIMWYFQHKFMIHEHLETLLLLNHCYLVVNIQSLVNIIHNILISALLILTLFTDIVIVQVLTLYMRFTVLYFLFVHLIIHGTKSVKFQFEVDFVY